VRITAWSAISPFGYGRAAFLEGLRAGRPSYQVPGFDIAEQLGAKGTGSMDRSSALAVAAVGALLKDVATDASTGVVLGTTSGSTATQFAFTRESLVRRKPYFVNPALMPFALMNSAAAQCAIWHGLTGPNTTVANGRMSGLVALRYAGRLLAGGRASGLVCGAVEEHGEERALLERHLSGAENQLGEGCAVLFLEPAGPGGGLADVVAVDTRLVVDESPHRTLAGCLRQVLRDAEVTPGAVSAVAVSSSGDVERAAVEEVLGGMPTMVDPALLTGDTGAATGVFQMAALLGLAGDGAGWAVATCADRDGMVGCALLRLLGKDVAG
jgi:3-oxoacyl-[acyl-carrier-protein] synthase II